MLIIIIAALGLGLGMAISAVTTKYRDLAFVITFGVPLLMYTTTVIYPLSIVVKKYPAYSWIIKYNPVSRLLSRLSDTVFLEKVAFDWESVEL